MPKLTLWPRIIRGTQPTPEDPTPSNEVAVELHGGGSCTITGAPNDRVIQEYESALAEHPDDPGLHLHYGVSLARGGRTEEALRGIRRAVELDPSFNLARALLAGVLQEGGRADEAIAEYGEVVARLEEQNDPGSQPLLRLARKYLSEALSQQSRRSG